MYIKVIAVHAMVLLVKYIRMCRKQRVRRRREINRRNLQQTNYNKPSCCLSAKLSLADASARLQENPAVANTFCNAFQSPCRGEMQQQSSAPWGSHSWTARSDFCMLIQLHDYVIFFFLFNFIPQELYLTSIFMLESKKLLLHALYFTTSVKCLETIVLTIGCTNRIHIQHKPPASLVANYV